MKILPNGPDEAITDQRYAARGVLAVICAQLYWGSFMQRYLARLCAVLGVAAALAGSARASGIVFSFESICTMNCGSISLTVGEPVFGSILIAEDAVVGGGTVNLPHILGIDLIFGAFEFTLSSLADFSGTLDLDASAFSTYFLVATGAAEGYFVTNTVWFAGPNPMDAAAGPGATLARVQVVPEPSVLALVALALLALAVGRGRVSQGRVRFSPRENRT